MREYSDIINSGVNRGDRLLHNFFNSINYQSNYMVDRVERAFGGSKLAGDVFKITAGVGLPLALGYGIHRYISQRPKLKEKIPWGQLRNGGNVISRVLNNHNIKFAFSLSELQDIKTINECSFENKMKVIQMKNYNNAIVAAGGVFRMTGQIGVVFVNGGPEIISMINGIVNAKVDNIPLVVIAINPIIGEQDFDKKLLNNYFKYITEVTNINEISEVLEDSFAKSVESEHSSSVLIEISQSLLLPEEETKEYLENFQKSRWYINKLWDEISGRTFKYPSETTEISFHYPRLRMVESPKNKHVENVMNHLVKAKYPILVIGDQCLVSNNINNKDLNLESLKLSIQLLGVPTFLNGFSKCLGTMGINNIVNDSMEYALERCDLLISMGISSPSFINDLNINTLKTKVYSIEEFSQPASFSNKFGFDLVERHACDPSAFLLHLGFIFPKSHSNKWNKWLYDLQEKDSIGLLINEKKSDIKVDNINPFMLIRSLKDTFKRLEKPPVIVSDKGEFCDVANTTLGGSVLSLIQPSKFSSHSSSIGLAIASKLCFPETDVYMLTDNISIINCVQEFGTLSYYRLPINIIVANNEKHSIINPLGRDIVNLQNQQPKNLMDNQSKNQEAPRTAFHKIMNAYGGNGFIINKDHGSKDDIENIILDGREKSINTHRPVLFNVWTDIPKQSGIGGGAM
ncbi:hypothetical protein ACTFIW_008665 [Dictyostelium discoideum]